MASRLRSPAPPRLSRRSGTAPRAYPSAPRHSVRRAEHLEKGRESDRSSRVSLRSGSPREGLYPPFYFFPEQPRSSRSQGARQQGRGRALTLACPRVGGKRPPSTSSHSQSTYTIDPCWDSGLYVHICADICLWLWLKECMLCGIMTHLKVCVSVNICGTVCVCVCVLWCVCTYL